LNPHILVCLPIAMLFRNSMLHIYELLEPVCKLLTGQF
jgi:hypothetical protein